ncbi:MAG TPA: 3-oxoadipate--succinyl-CoA transferase subunit B, partial [Burkholderiales bacterium]|nr:3-oxoadipate--succinyl-CoA transferase subunit B [Burkholderiales bacterium]
RFVERVDFVTSPGFLGGGSTRRDSGLAAGGMYRVVTDLGLFGFDEETKRMKIVALHPGVTVSQVQENTGFEMGASSDIRVTDPPKANELAFLRRLDPERLYTA